MVTLSHRLRSAGRMLPALALAIASTTLAPRALAQRVTLDRHVPSLINSSRASSPVSPDERMQLTFALPLRNTAALDDLLRRLYDPLDPLHGKFLSPADFASRFGPTQDDYNAVAAFARSQGLRVTGTHANRLLLDVEGPAATVQRALGVQLMRFIAPDGTLYRAPVNNPSVPASLQGRVACVAGLDNLGVRHTNFVERAPEGGPFGGYTFDAVTPHAATGPAGGLSPSDIKTAYNLNSLSLNGSGQTLALFELDGYRASDITAYESYFKLPYVALQNVLIDGFSGQAGGGAGEVTLDIELMIALAPGCSKILVYEGPNSTNGVLHTYNRIATDNLAKQVSTSWGLDEKSSGSSILNAEYAIFQQMAAQGQTIYAASGDAGAYDNGSSLSVDDPASQPYVVGVGGTTLRTGSGSVYSSETTWYNSYGGGGGGISSFWTIPAWQAPVISTASRGSKSMRNVPDVALNADPGTGYSIYYSGRWTVMGGTSCAAPLWAAYTALVNQQRAASGKSPIGYLTPTLYSIGTGGRYLSDFHDVADNSTNVYYPSVSGYDCATGWGSFNGAQLMADLAGVSAPTVSAPTGLTATAGASSISLSWTAVSGATSYNLYRATAKGGEMLYRSGLTGTTFTDSTLNAGVTYYYQVTAVKSGTESVRSNEASAVLAASTSTSSLLGNPGFENGSANPSPWMATLGVIDKSTSRPAHSGTWKAWLCGYGFTHTDVLYQTVTIPSTAKSAALSFWLRIDTAERSTVANDTLKVQVRDTAGNVLATLATYSNLNATAAYAQKSFDLSAYKGRSIRIYLLGTENRSLQTSFVVDDFALTVQ